MNLYPLVGSCHCGAIRVSVGLAQAPETYAPRACDCSFCRKHAAAYVSDPAGSLRISVAEPLHLGRYQQGSGSADCLVCTRCGVLVGVAYNAHGRIFATLNSHVVDGEVRFADPVVVSPQTLSAADKIARWQALWFADVVIAMA